METRNNKKLIKSKTIHIRVTEKDLKLIDLAAEKHEQRRSEFIRYHFINLLNQYSNNL